MIWGFGVALAVYLTAGISGAHLNPAITVTFWLFAHFDRKKSTALYYCTNAGRLRRRRSRLWVVLRTISRL